VRWELISFFRGCANSGKGDPEKAIKGQEKAILQAFQVSVRGEHSHNNLSFTGVSNSQKRSDVQLGGEGERTTYLIYPMDRGRHIMQGGKGIE